MEQLTIAINKPDEFDRAVHGDDKMPALPSGETLEIITKDEAMHGADGKRRAAAVITFMVDVDGKPRRAQFTTSVRLLRTALQAIDAGYEDGLPIPGTFGR